jgi:hypothetical protein
MKILEQRLIAKMQQSFKLVDNGKATWILGMAINQNENGVSINQVKYINDILKKYGMENCKPQSTPVEKGGE